MIRVLSQADAHHDFKKRGYNKYDPCVVIVADSEQEIQDSVVITVAGIRVRDKIDIHAIPGTSVDVSQKGDVRLVVWIGK